MHTRAQTTSEKAEATVHADKLIVNKYKKSPTDACVGLFERRDSTAQRLDGSPA